MGARPIDFDESIVRQAPTFLRWLSLTNGQKLRYACRDFVKGHGDDEERLMRRIMIARRNNLRDHEMLKRARTASRAGSGTLEAIEAMEKRKVSTVLKVETNPASPKKRRPTGTSGMSDAEVIKEMDTPAVEATRSYKSWVALEDGKEFTYNQKYIKGKEGHDWLLRKNIWRRMRYRRENKKMVEKMKSDTVQVAVDAGLTVHAAADHAIASAAAAAAATATHIVDQALLAGTAAAAAVTTPGSPSGDHVAAAAAASSIGAAGGASSDLVHKAVVEAAVAAAASYVQKQRESQTAESATVAAAAAAAAVEATAAAIVAKGEEATAAVRDDIGAIAAMQLPADATDAAAAAVDAVNNPIMSTNHMAPTPNESETVQCPEERSENSDTASTSTKVDSVETTPNPLASVVAGSALVDAAQLTAVAPDPQKDDAESMPKEAGPAINAAPGVKVEAI